MHAVPFIPAISFKLAERERFFYVDADRFTRTPLPLFFLFPRVIIQIRKLLARPLPPPRFVYRSLLQIHFVSARFVQLKLKKNGDTINRMLRTRGIAYTHSYYFRFAPPNKLSSKRLR